METKTILLALLVIAVFFVVMPPSKIQGVEKYTSDPGYADSDATVVTPDALQKVIQATQTALSKQIGMCTYCIETTSIALSGDTYTGRFLFVALPGASGSQWSSPYGIGVDSTVDGKTYTVSNIALQSNNTIDQMDPYEQFRSGSEIQEGTLPTLAQLQSALNSS
jgi:hypothetical protein